MRRYPPLVLPLWLLMLSTLAPGVLRAEMEKAAQVVFSSGTVTVRDSTPGSSPSPLVRGAMLHGEQVISTGSDSRAQLRFTDGSSLSLNPDSEFHIDRYQFTPSRPEKGLGFFRLLKGGLRTITGLIGKTRRDSYRMSTIVATIGIRGTDYSVNYDSNGGVTVSTHGGQIEVCNSGGCVLVGAGENARIPDGNTRPLLGGIPQAAMPPPIGAGEGGFSAAGERRDGSGAAQGFGSPGTAPPPTPPNPPTVPSTSPRGATTYMPRGM